MDLNIFSTQAVQANAPLSGSDNPLLGGKGLGGINGLAFLEAILGNLDADAEIEVGNENLENDVPSDGVKKETADLALLQLALLGQDVDKNLDEKLAELKIEKLVHTEENRIAQITKLIDHLTSGLPQEASDNTSIEDLVSRLNNRLEKLTTSLNAFRNNDFGDEDAPFKLLIATGLNPAQFTKITSRIEEVEEKLGRELTIEDLIAGVGNIIPAPGDDDHEFSGTDALTLLLKHSSEDSGDSLKKTDPQEVDNNKNVLEENEKSGPIKNYDMQALLNMIAANNIAPINTQGNTIQPTVGKTILPEDGITPLPQALSNAEFKALFGGNKNNNFDLKNATAKLATANITPGSAIPKLGMAGDLTLPANWNTSQQMLSELLGFDIQTGTPFSHIMQAVHTTTMTQSAGQPHPGTSMVAAKMTQAAKSGDTRNITLQLDPPELGRVEVRMEFGSDNQVKAHLIVEKHETYLMLQRDAAALERALQDAGMETGSDSLDYEMAEDNYNFGDDKNGRNGDSGTENAGNNSDETDEEIIETTMNWDVDPNTGHVHYNIIA